MNNSIIKRVLPYCLAIVAFIIIGYSYAPYTLEGKVVNQSDISSWQGMSHEIVEWNEAHPEDPTYWTNSMFSGMPANTISIIYKGDYTKFLYDLLFVGQRPASYIILSLIGGFLLFLAFGVNIWLAIFGAIAISFCSYNMQIIQVGHNTKMIAIAFIPWVLAAIVYAYRKRWLLGSVLFGLVLSFQIKANHPQISYYLAIIVLGFVVWQFFDALKNSKLKRFFKTSLALLVAGLIGIATNINHLWPTYEYSKQSMRGGSELVQDDKGEKREGLDLVYATQWSYGVEETPNLFIPNFNGGASVGELSKESETYRVLKNSGYSGAEQVIKQLPLYWGPQSFTAGPMYMGAISIFLFILGLFIIKGGMKWWIVAVSFLAILLSWGHHFMLSTEIFFKYAPLYNKFRTVSMILVILQITIPILAVITLDILLNENSEYKINIENKELKKKLLWGVALSGGIALLFLVIPTLAGEFTNSSIDNSLPKELVKALAADRISLLRSDAFRTLIFVLITCGILWITVKKRIQPKYTYIILIALLCIDLWGVDKRYLNSSHFVTKSEFNSPLQKRGVDEIIISSTKDLNYRVLDLSIDPFNNAYTSYWHKTIGGYSPAKLQRYQELIDKYISSQASEILKDLQKAQVKTISEAQEALTNYPVLNMLNTKYIIIDGSQPPLENNRALGNCWFVEKVVEVDNPNEEIAKLGEIDPANTVIVSKTFTEQNKNLQEFAHSLTFFKTDTIADKTNLLELTSYAPNRLKYNYSSSSDKIAMFSEVYYSPGWRAYFTGVLNGEKVKEKELDIFRGNYILRGLYLPKGEGEIMFYYQPENIIKGAIYSKISSLLLLLLLVLSLFLTFRKGGKRTTDL